MAKNVYQAFGTDKRLESSGIVLDFGAFKITVARAGGGNAAYREAVRKHLRPLRDQLARDMLSDEDARPAMVKIYAESVVLGWEGITDPEGNPLAFTPANVIRVLTDLPDLFEEIRNRAQDFSNFRELEDGEAVAHLGKSSNGVTGMEARRSGSKS